MLPLDKEAWRTDSTALLSAELSKILVLSCESDKRGFHPSSFRLKYPGFRAKVSVSSPDASIIERVKDCSHHLPFRYSEIFRRASAEEEDVDDPGIPSSSYLPSKQKMKWYTSFNKVCLKDKDFAKWLVKENNFTVKCVLCPITFPIKFEERKVIAGHHNSQKHILTEQQRRPNQARATFLVKKKPHTHTSEENAVSRTEMASVYHYMKYDQNAGDTVLFHSLESSLVEALPKEASEWRRSYGRAVKSVFVSASFIPFSKEILPKGGNWQLTHQPVFHIYWTECMFHLYEKLRPMTLHTDTISMCRSEAVS
uniref:TRAPPC10/Trs130 N-terminal domain-containing protein n=1 Tax=Timema cristinae TaxID=61476 RepID=A0A7R9CLU5_TIMCR|nr:unnamed protein product [Timema cristinae]